MRALGSLAAAVSAMLLVCGFGGDTARVADAPVIVTAAPAYLPLAALHGAGLERFPKGAQLLLVEQGKAESLVTGFAATADASVSFDGKSVLFAGKKAASDPWQVWELTLTTHSVRQVTNGAADAIRPLYLPDNRLVYAQRTARGFAVVAAGLDGTNSLPLTYIEGSAVPSDVLADGRILFEAGFPLGSGAAPELYLVYSDGSGVESYRCDHPMGGVGGRWGGKQLASGDVVFTHGASLARFTSPLAHEERIAAPHAEYAGAIAETATGAWLLSARAAAGAHYALKLWKPSAAPLETVLAKSGEDLVEPVVVAAHPRPKRHPSGLHPWDFANLLALDARLSRDGALKSTPASVRLETQDPAGHAITMGTAPIESDGSFFLSAPGNKPIRFALLDAKGNVLRQERGWFWSRGGEQRICVGCHTGPERASDNRVPAVLLRTTIPQDLTGSHRKTIEQHVAAGSH